LVVPVSWSVAAHDPSNCCGVRSMGAAPRQVATRVIGAWQPMPDTVVMCD